MVDSIVADCRQDDVQWAEAAAEPVALKVLNTHKPGDCDVMDVDDEWRNSIMAPHASPPSLKTVLPSGSPLIQSNAHQPPCTALADPHSAAPEKDIANMGRVIALCSQNALQRSMERTAAAKRRVEQLWERLGWDSREQKRARAEAEESAG
ncbi:unnamed protein product [Ostreobium quekettii]|uniref:Uncharacterized protein n=1 Tax=Ostreobium quekettii TaxID=121088 RepID=A0A8S1ISE1_9CHLO|nr:unnamed protein product [Ostreobium quekettii]